MSYTATSSKPHTVEVNYGGVAVKDSPYRVYVSTPLDPSKVSMAGPWLEGVAQPGKPTHFNVDARY